MRTVERIAPTTIRVVGGLIFAGLGALAGMVLAGISLPPGTDRTPLLTARILFIGLGATAGASLPWWRPGQAVQSAVVAILLIGTGALAGAVAGLVFADLFQEHYDPLRRVQQISRTMVYGASIGANALPVALDIRALITRRRGGRHRQVDTRRFGG